MASGAAELLRQVKPEQARIAELVPEFAVDLMVLSPTLLIRRRLLSEELRRVLAQFAMRIGLPRGAVPREQFGHSSIPFRSTGAQGLSVTDRRSAVRRSRRARYKCIASNSFVKPAGRLAWLAMVNPRATNEDLTAKARIRNAALDLYSQYGPDRVSLRAIAAEAGVTLGLVQHHFKTKAGLRDAVDQLIVDYFSAAIAEVPIEGTTAEIAAARDNAVRRMLEQNPPVVDYVRRALLEQSDSHLHLLDVLVDL